MDKAVTNLLLTESDMFVYLFTNCNTIGCVEQCMMHAVNNHSSAKYSTLIRGPIDGISLFTS